MSTAHEFSPEASNIPLAEFILVDGHLRPTRNSEGRFIHPDIAVIEAFYRWFGDSHAMDDEGRPRVVYRGEHAVAAQPHSRLGSWSYGSRALADEYATTPNNRKADPDALQPKVFPVYLQLRKPLINDPDDPFIDFSVIWDELGMEVAIRAAHEVADVVTENDIWHESFSHEFDSLADLIAARPEALRELYVYAYALLDKPWFVQVAKEKGFDGAIHGEYGIHTDHPEFKTFDLAQSTSAISVGIQDDFRLPRVDTVWVDGVERPRLNSRMQAIAASDEALTAFWRWFGDSKLTDAMGRPLVVYHGTDSDFGAFHPGTSYFTPRTDYSYIKNSTFVMPVYLRMERPFRPEHQSQIEQARSAEDWVLQLQGQGFDGLAWAKEGDWLKGASGWGDDLPQLVTFRPDQVKSAIGNNGQFDPTNPHLCDSHQNAMVDMIMVEGVPRSCINSKGERIASTEAGLRAFWQWFGDSQALDPLGRPLVLYHGTRDGGFDTFNPELRGAFTGAPSAKLGFFFTPNQQAAEGYTGTRHLRWEGIRRAVDRMLERLQHLGYDNKLITGYSAGRALEMVNVSDNMSDQAIRYAIQQGVRMRIGRAIKQHRQFEADVAAMKRPARWQLHAITTGAASLAKAAAMLPAIDRIIATEMDLSTVDIGRREVMEVYLRIAKPAHYNDEGLRMGVSFVQRIHAATEQGSDGVCISDTNDPDPMDVWIAFHAEQIRLTESCAATRSPPGMICVDGVLRPRNNSAKQPIAATDEAICHFWRWFGNSVSVDKEGRPLVLYHGSACEFERFSLEPGGKHGMTQGTGVYFTNDRTRAEIYTKDASGVAQGMIYSAYIKTQSMFEWGPENPFMDALISGKGIPPTIKSAVRREVGMPFVANEATYPDPDTARRFSDAVTRVLQKKGYDCVRARKGTGYTYVALNPADIHIVQALPVTAPSIRMDLGSPATATIDPLTPIMALEPEGVSL